LMRLKGEDGIIHEDGDFNAAADASGEQTA
jgi:hypothetical protein